jgi:hypothetical protein
MSPPRCWQHSSSECCLLPELRAEVRLVLVTAGRAGATKSPCGIGAMAMNADADSQYCSAGAWNSSRQQHWLFSADHDLH